MGKPVLFDPEGFDRDDAVDRYEALNRRWLKFDSIKSEMDVIMSRIIAFDLWEQEQGCEHVFPDVKYYEQPVRCVLCGVPE